MMQDAKYLLSKEKNLILRHSFHKFRVFCYNFMQKMEISNEKNFST